MAAVPATALTRSYSVDLIFTNKILNMQTSWYLKTSRELEVSSIFLIVNLSGSSYISLAAILDTRSSSFIIPFDTVYNLG